MQITFGRFKENLAQLPNPEMVWNETSIHLSNKSWLLLQKKFVFISKWYHFKDTTFVMLICETFHWQRMLLRPASPQYLLDNFFQGSTTYIKGSTGYSKKLLIEQ